MLRTKVAIAALAYVLVIAASSSLNAEPAGITCTEPSGYHVFFEERICPIGGEVYQAPRLGTHSTFGAYLDLTRVSYLSFPIAMPVCPENGFVDYQADYSDDEIKKLTAVIEDEAYRSLLGRHTSWYLFAKMAEMAELSDIDRWWLYSRAAAEADTCGLETYADYAMEAQEVAMEALLASDPSDAAYWPLQLLIANYDRRLGAFDQARERVAGLHDIPDEWKLAFGTLSEAIRQEESERVKIGHYEEKNDEE